MEQKRITITEDELLDAIKAANDKFKDKVTEKDDTPDGVVPTLMMTLQNIAFGFLLCEVLFAENVSSEDTENTEPTINA